MRFSLSGENHRSVGSTIVQALVWAVEHPADVGDATDQYVLMRLLMDAAERMSNAIPHDQDDEADDPFVREGIANMVDDVVKRNADAKRDASLTMIEKRQDLINILQASNEAERKQQPDVKA